MGTEDKIQEALGKEVKFGLKQMSNPTPMAAVWGFRIISALVGIWALIQHFHLGLTPEQTAAINEWAVAAIPIAHVVHKQFGWAIPSDNNQNQ